MLRYIYADTLPRYPVLSQTMFHDRADQFKTRLNWEVIVNDKGEERDEYDVENPLYVIWEGEDGRHKGSIRFLPTTGPTMINDHFSDLLAGGTIESPFVWECTRFCLSRDAKSSVAAALMLSGSELMRQFGIKHFAGVFDERMVRIYRRIGWAPEIIGSTGRGRDKVSIGLWQYDEVECAKVATRAEITLDQSEMWFRDSFEPLPEVNLV